MALLQSLQAILSHLEELGNTVIKLIGTYEVVLWRLLVLYLAITHLLAK